MINTVEKRPKLKTFHPMLMIISEWSLGRGLSQCGRSSSPCRVYHGW